MSNAQLPADANPIEVNGQVVDPNEHYARDARNTDHIILTTRDVLDNDQRAELHKNRVEFLEDLGDHNILCRYEPSNLEPLRELKFVKQVDVYRNLYKIPAILMALVEEYKGKPEFETEAFPIDVMVHQEVKDMEALVDHISKVTQVEQNQMQITHGKIRLDVTLNELEAIAADDRVRILEEVVTPVLCDDHAKQLVSAPLPNQGSTEFRGQGQIIAVFDSGFDLGSIEDCHPAFISQIERLIPEGRASDKNKTDAQRVDDPKGHGTHVCGTIVGKDFETSQGIVGGVAQDAKVVLTSLEKADGDLIAVPSLKALYEVPHEHHDAYILSNSWGDGLGLGRTQRPYGESAAAIDSFVRANPDALICFSAGNQNIYRNEKEPRGTQKPSIGSQAAAKNCLTIGASGSTREIANPAHGKIGKLPPDLICPDSSRGPTLENRIKPDIVAPGFNIFSAHSRHPKAVTVSGAEATNESNPKVLWKVRSGTSHATPLVSGCAAILRQIMQCKGLQKPPAALLKAVIINGADKLHNVDVAAQGFGRVNLQASVAMVQSLPVLPGQIGDLSLSPLGGCLVGAPLKLGESFIFTLSQILESGDREFKITIVYNDPPAGQIQNNLNLAVSDTMTGDIKHGGISEDEIDKQNNVEQITWYPAPKVPMTIRVTAQKILKTESSQDYALAWSMSTPFLGSK